MDSITFCQDDLPHLSFSSFEEMRRKGQFCDLTLRIGNHSFKAHQNIVAAAIPYFVSVFMGGDVEIKEKEFEVEDLDPTALESLIDFAYSGKVNISSENVKSLLVASLFLHLSQVRDACVQFLTERLNVNSIIKIHAFACSTKYSDLIENCDTWICKNFEEFSKCDDFLILPHSFIKAVISKDDLNVPNEEVVFEAVIRWVKNSPTERHDVLPDLLNEIRMIYLPKEYLLWKVSSEELIKNSMLCKDLIEEVKNYHMLPRAELLFLRLKTRPRNLWSHIYAVGSCNSCGFSVHHFDVRSETWYPLTIRKEHGTICSVVGVNEKIYTFVDERILIFSLNSRDWEILPSKCKETKGTAVLSYGNKIYFFGSVDSNFQDVVRCFDLERHHWLQEEKINLSWAYCAATSEDECIYVTGSYSVTSQESYNTVQKYVPSTHEWSDVARMLTPRGKHCCTRTNGKIYVCGGQTTGPVTLNSAEVYDSSTNQWNYISAMKTSLHSFSVVQYCNKLYAFGKDNSEVYDPETGEWKLCLAVPEGFVAAVTASKFFWYP